MFSKPIILTLLVSLAFNGLFGYLSYHFYGVKQALKGELMQCQQNTLSLEKSVENHRKLCALQDSISTEWKKEEQEAEKDTESFVEQIDKVVVAKKATVVAKEATSNETKQTYVDMDSSLPPDIVRVLGEACLRAKGSPCSRP